MRKWIILLVLLVLFAVIALAIPVYSRASLGMGVGALAVTLLNEVVEILYAK